MHDAALPLGVRIELGRALDAPHAGIRDDQLDTRQAALLEGLEEGAPALLVFLGSLEAAEGLAVAVGLDSDRNQQRDVAHFTCPTALQDNAVQIEVGPSR